MKICTNNVPRETVCYYLAIDGAISAALIDHYNARGETND